MDEEIKYKAKHVVSTGEFSKVEIDVEATMPKIVAQARWLHLQFKDIPKK